jgi:hypothetical protein
MHLNHKRRWVFSPMVSVGEEQKPLVAEYSLEWESPLIYEGFALTHCVMNAHQFAAAKKDPKLIVLPTIQARQPIDPKVAEHHAKLGVVAGMLLHEALEALAAHHPNFAPEE